ncbi:MAG: glycosyltransferase family 39 protein [Acidisphaera sp.]|nr:glycosyltransferase family 39 protein [Acidisphaera sp.]
MELRGFRDPGLAPELGGGRRAWAAALLALTLLRLLIAALLPLSPDEAYYWVWSRALAPGYLDHPPMVALWIRAGTALAGQGAFGVRLFAPLSAAAGSLLLARAAEDLLPGRRAGLTAALLLNATLLFGVGAVTMTPDTPLLFFWTASLSALARLLRTGNAAWWLAAGAAAGLSLASKYTGVLLLGGVGVWLLVVPGARPWLKRWQCWAGLALALAIFLPTLLWNARHGWVSFVKQGGRGLVWDPAGALRHVGELLGGQLGLATPLVFLLCLAGVAWTLPRRDPPSRLLAALALVPALVFLEHALGDRVQANWPAVIYPAAAVAAAGPGRPWRRLVLPAAALGAAVTLLVYVQALAAPFALPPRLDPTLRLAGWPTLAAEVEQARRAASADYIAADGYGEAALLARLLPPEVPVVAVAPRWALFRLPEAGPTIDGRPGLLLRTARRGDAPDPADWSSLTPAAGVARDRAGAPLELYRLFRVTGRAGGEPAVLLPHP